MLVNESDIVVYKPNYIPFLTKLPAHDAPVLAEISPSVDKDGTIKLDWTDVTGAISYNVYRESNLIEDTDGLTAIANPTSSGYTDRKLEDGIYYYAITTLGNLEESIPSNCRFVVVERLLIPGFSVAMLSIIGLIGVVVIAGAVSTKIKVRK